MKGPQRNISLTEYYQTAYEYLMYIVFQLGERFTMGDIRNMTVDMVRYQLRGIYVREMNREMFFLAALKRNYLDKKDVGTNKYIDFIDSGRQKNRDLTEKQKDKISRRKLLHELRPGESTI